MTAVIATHAVGNMDRWLKSRHREQLFANVCSRYRLFRHADGQHVSYLFEDVDLSKLEAMAEAPEIAAAKAEDTVVDPIDFFIEIEDGK